MNEKRFDMGLIVGSDIRTRDRINEIKSQMSPEYSYILDFSLVEFISRSFADELINLIEDYPNKVSVIGANREVESMISIVKKGRIHTSTKDYSKGVRVLKNLQELERFFSCL